MGGETYATGRTGEGKSESDRTAAGRGGRREGTGKLPAHLQDGDRRGRGRRKRQRAEARQYGGGVKPKDAIVDGRSAGVAASGAAEVPLSCGGLGQGSDIRTRAAVGELGVKGIVPGGSASQRQRPRGNGTVGNRPRVTPDDGVGVGNGAGKHRGGTRDGEESIGGSGVRTQVQAADPVITLIDEGGSGAVENEVGGGVGGGADAAGDTAVGEDVHGDLRAGGDSRDPGVGTLTEQGLGAGDRTVDDHVQDASPVL